MALFFFKKQTHKNIKHDNPFVQTLLKKEEEEDNNSY